MVSHPETGSDSPIGSDQDRGRDTGSRIYEKFYKILKQGKASKQEIYEKFYKRLKQGKASKQV